MKDYDGQPPSDCFDIKGWLLAGVCALVAALLFMGPILTNPSQLATGIRSHNSFPVILFNWWFGKAFWDIHTSPIFCPYFAHPFGTNLAMLDAFLIHVLHGAIQPAAGILTARNLFQIILLVFSTLCSFALIKHYVQHTIAAMVGALLATYHLLTSDFLYYDNIYYFVVFGFISLTVLLWERCVGKRRIVIAAGCSLFLTFMATSYYGISTVFLISFLCIASWTKHRSHMNRKIIDTVLVFGIAFMGLCLVYISGFFLTPGGHDLVTEVIVGQKDVRIIQGSLTDNGKFEVFKRDFKEAVQSKSAVKAGRSVQKTMFSTPLSSFFTLPSNLRNRRTGAQPEKSFYLGYLRLIIALAGICLGGKTIRRWGLAALIFFLLGLGSPIRLGNHLVPGLWSMVKTLVPGTSFLSQPSRFLVVLHIALGVCCAAGLKRLMSSRSRITKYLGVIIIMAVLAETAFTAWYLRFNVHSMQIPECYQYVRSDRENCALMDIYPPETDEKTVQEIMITQIVHNKAVQMPPAIYSPSLAFLPHRLFLGLLIERLANDKAINEIIPLASKKFVALLQGFKIKYVVLHMYLFDKYTGSKLLRILTNDFGSPVDQTGNRYIFRTYNDGSIKKQPLPALIRDGLTLEHLLTLVDQSDSFADLLEKLLKKN